MFMIICAFLVDCIEAVLSFVFIGIILNPLIDVIFLAACGFLGGVKIFSKRSWSVVVASIFIKEIPVLSLLPAWTFWAIRMKMAKQIERVVTPVSEEVEDED